VIKKPIETKIVEEAKPPPPPETPPPPPPKLAPPPPPFIPPPEVNIAVTPPAAATITAVTTTPPPPVATIAPTPPPAHVPVRVPPVIDAAHNCPTPQFPPASARAEETGTVTMRFYIDEEGRAVKSEIVRSSGHKRLDEAARAALSLCKFKPGTLDGKVVPMTGDIQYVWKLE
jgi:protein TonB